MKRITKETMKEKLLLDTHSLVLMGLLIAIQIVLSRFVSIQAWNMRIGFGFVPIVLAGMLLGPIKAGLVAATSDIIGAVLFPSGTFYFGFTLTALLVGILYGILLYRRQNFIRILFAVGIHQCILSLFLNTLWISVVYGVPYWPLLASRLVQTSIMIPVQLVCITVLCNKKISKIWAYT